MLKVSSALELNGAAVCVQQGTTTELNLADYFRSNNMTLKTVTFATVDEAAQGLRYRPLRCLHDGFLGALRCTPATDEPDDNIVLPEIISKEPLSPSVRQGDDMWENIVRWTHYAMLDAEEFGITKS